MKKITYILLILIFSGCQKILHEQDFKISQIKTVAEMDVAMNGLYARLAQYINCYYSAPQYLTDDMPYEVISNGIPDTFFRYSDVTVETFTTTYTNILIPFNNYNWRNLYNIITNANNIISQFQNNSNVKIELRAGVGEAYLIRAYAYFRLVRIFGQVPIVDNVDINTNLPASSYKDIYSFIESDLLKAASYLPNNKAIARVPNQTPVSGSAKAMLAEVYLTMGGYPLLDNTKYILAAQIAKDVIDSANIYGFMLLPDYSNLWVGTNMLNNEVLFGLFFSNMGNGQVYHVDGGRYGSTYEYSETRNIFGLSTPIPKENFINTFPGSYRKDVTIQNIFESKVDTPVVIDDSMHYIRKIKYIKYNTWHNGMYYKKFGYIQYFDTASSAIAYGRKNYYLPGYPSYGYWLSVDSVSKNLVTIFSNYAQPIYIYRYAHTLLTYAEAKARSGQLDASAYQAVNMIRRRANKTDMNSPSKYDLQPGLSATQFADSVVQERAWEFCGEPEGRWYDLVRCEMIEQLPRLRGDNHAMTRSDYFDAIPDGEKVLDPNLK